MGKEIAKKEYSTGYIDGFTDCIDLVRGIELETKSKELKKIIDLIIKRLERVLEMQEKANGKIHD